MSEWEWEEFTHKAATVATAALARDASTRTALEPLFNQTLLAHPDEEDRLLAVWDRLTSRAVL
jgi:hypothetical protein